MSKKKTFPRAVFSSTPSVPDSGDWTSNPPASERLVHFPLAENHKGRRTFSFAPWYGAGFDAITAACQRQVERFLSSHDRSLSTATLVTYCTPGLQEFLNFLAVWRSALDHDLGLTDINRSLVDGFLRYLEDRKLATASRKVIYNSVKPVLQALGRRRLVQIVPKGEDATFPRNPFPGVHRSLKGERPLPRLQRLAFTAAVKTDVMPIFRDDVQVTSELLAYALLVVALHTGRNTVPLLELSPLCLRAHPKNGTRFLVVYKRRGNKAQGVAVPSGERVVESTPAVRPTVVRLIERVAELTADLRRDAPDHLRDRLWLYRSRQEGKDKGAIRALSMDTLQTAASKLVQRHNLVEPDGRPVRVNCSRLRKTFINRINEILDGDVVTTAAAAGNSPQVTGTTYLRPGEHAKRDWSFMGRVLTEELLSGTIGKTEKTPSGRCTDTTNGQFAPRRDGLICTNFLDCFRCRNYAVTAEDLHKVFSVYWRVYRERNRVGQWQWEKRYAHIPRIIERDVVAAGVRSKAFTQQQADGLKERARVAPHPYWGSDSVLEAFR